VVVLVPDVVVVLVPDVVVVLVPDVVVVAEVVVVEDALLPPELSPDAPVPVTDPLQPAVATNARTTNPARRCIMSRGPRDPPRRGGGAPHSIARPAGPSNDSCVTHRFQ
jgi:hypothetical protein